jgi:hypothetical protein
VTQNQANFGLLVVPQNRWREVDAGHALRFSGLLRVEASRVRVFQSDLKTGGDMTTGDVYGIITEIAWS